VRGSNAAWLFPGVAGEPKTANMFSTQITERIQKATGLRMTVHQFRHACAAIYLKLRVSRDREHGFQRIVSNDFRGS